MSNKSPFGSASHCRNMGSSRLAAPPPTVVQSRHILIVDLANGKKHIPIFRKKPWRPQLRHQTYYAFLHERQIQNLGQRHGILCKHNASIMQSWWNALWLSGTCLWREWMIENPKRNSRNRFLRHLRQTCRTNLLWAVRII